MFKHNAAFSVLYCPCDKFLKSKIGNYLLYIHCFHVKRNTLASIIFFFCTVYVDIFIFMPCQRIYVQMFPYTKHLKNVIIFPILSFCLLHPLVNLSIHQHELHITAFCHDFRHIKCFPPNNLSK